MGKIKDALYFILIVVSMVDAVTTYLSMKAGNLEVKKIPKWIIDKFGELGFVIAKVVLCIVIIVFFEISLNIEAKPIINIIKWGIVLISTGYGVYLNGKASLKNLENIRRKEDEKSN